MLKRDTHPDQARKKDINKSYLSYANVLKIQNPQIQGIELVG